MIEFTSTLKEIQRESVKKSYEAAESKNKLLYARGDIKATEEYIYDNQKVDACNIIHTFYETECRAVSIQKKTKVGADGLMIEIASRMATHPDDTFIVNLENIRIITGMSNVVWERDMKDKVPELFKDKIFHHGKLSKSKLSNLKNALIIIDEIDTGDKEFQKLYTELREAQLLDVEHMKQNNNRYIFISATIVQQINELKKWGDLHVLYKMTIPSLYIGHKELLDKGIIKEFYALSSVSKVKKWIEEDIVENYGNDYRIHIVRVNKNAKIVHQGCNEKGILFINHTSQNRITQQELEKIFVNEIDRHIVIGIKGFFRRANLIPNNWKVRIGATHELYTKVDYNVQIQGLPGRMTGYWRDVIESGHKTGPYRTSIEAVINYDANYNNFYCKNDYKTAGFVKKRGKVKTMKVTLVDPKHIQNLNKVDVGLEELKEKPIIMKYKDFNDAKRYVKETLRNPRGPNKPKTNSNGFYECNVRGVKKVWSTKEMSKEQRCNIKNGAGYGIKYCYDNVEDKSTLQIWIIHYRNDTT